MRRILVVCTIAACVLPALAASALDADVPNVEGTVLYVWKNQHQMMLVENGRTLHRFDVKIGKNSDAPKRLRGDSATPEGRYFIREKNPNSRFRRFLGLNYPNLVDADRALDRGFIDGAQWADIFFANMQRKVPPPSTVLGGRVGIHGYGGRPPLEIDWTEGCIAVTDDEIDYLYQTVDLGTPVIIFE